LKRVEELRNIAGKDTIILLVGNKNDLKEEGQEIVTALENIYYIETNTLNNMILIIH
jgi:GTPase SAR1 family protein